MMNLSLKPFIIASMAMNIMTLMVTPAMHTSDCRLCDMKYRMATIHRIRSPAFVVVQVFNLHVQTESLHYNLVKRLKRLFHFRLVNVRGRCGIHELRPDSLPFQ